MYNHYIKASLRSVLGLEDRVKAGKALCREEREMFAAAYKGAMSSRRLAVRVCRSVQSQEVGPLGAFQCLWVAPSGFRKRRRRRRMRR